MGWNGQAARLLEAEQGISAEALRRPDGTGSCSSTLPGTAARQMQLSAPTSRHASCTTQHQAAATRQENRRPVPPRSLKTERPVLTKAPTRPAPESRAGPIERPTAERRIPARGACAAGTCAACAQTRRCAVWRSRAQPPPGPCAAAGAPESWQTPARATDTLNALSGRPRLDRAPRQVRLDLGKLLRAQRRAAAAAAAAARFNVEQRAWFDGSCNMDGSWQTPAQAHKQAGPAAASQRA